MALAGDEGIAETLADAQRSARLAVFASDNDKLRDSARQAGSAARDLGSASFDDARAGLDPSGLTRGAGLVLHDGEVPATRLGLGSKRLAGASFQLAASDGASILLIDEVEGGLETSPTGPPAAPPTGTRGARSGSGHSHHSRPASDYGTPGRGALRPQDG